MTRRPIGWIGCLAAAVLAAACTVVKVKDLDARALAAKGKRGKIVSVWAGDGTVAYAFSVNDPAVVRDGAVVGNMHTLWTIDPSGVADVAPGAAGPRIVMKDGTRFRVVASRPRGEQIECEAVQAIWIPLDEVARAKVRTVNAAAAVFNVFAGVAIVAGALVLDAALSGDDEDVDWDDTLTGQMLASVLESGGGESSPRLSKSNSAFLGMKNAPDVAEETEFWTLEWTPLDVRPGEDGKFRVPVDNRTGVPRGIDEAKLIVVDHPPGVSVAPDILGTVRSFSAPVAPESAVDGLERDIRDLVSAGDGVLWRTPGGDPVPAPSRDEITLSFPRPKGARSGRLVVGAANTCWRAEFARQAQARPEPGAPEKQAGSKGRKTGSAYQEWEYGKARVRLLTVNGWQTAQVLPANGPLPAADTIYDLSLEDVGTDKVWLKLALPSGYWLIDRLALDFGENTPVETTEVAAEEVDGPDAASVLEALAAEDGTTLRLAAGDAPATLTFTLPPAKAGMERSLFLRTVSCYETAGRIGKPTGSKGKCP